MQHAAPGSRTAYVLERLRDDVRNGVIAPGEQIRQVEVAKRYGVSPTPVREALRMLAAEGTIEYTTHRGATVRDYTPEMARHLYLMRAEMEALAVRVAMEQMTPRGYNEIKQVNDELVAATEQGAPAATLSQLNRKLHFEIYRRASPLMVEFIGQLWSRFSPTVTLWRDAHYIEQLRCEHDQILAAIENGDGDAAADAMRRHVLHAYDLRQADAQVRATGGTTTDDLHRKS